MTDHRHVDDINKIQLARMAQSIHGEKDYLRVEVMQNPIDSDEWLIAIRIYWWKHKYKAGTWDALGARNSEAEAIEKAQEVARYLMGALGVPREQIRVIRKNT